VRLGGEPVSNSPEPFTAIRRADCANWKQLVANAKVIAD
jgi:hypothetical protein